MPTLSWIGKDKVVNHHQEVPFYTLEHKYGFRGDDTKDKSETHSGNMIIHGDNLLALKALLLEYEGRVNCIYIDPPYNTGEEKWAYNDNVNDPHIKRWLEETLRGEYVGKEGEDLSRHDKWLCMMYPRLSLLQRLLHAEGAIFISCDDNEYAHLKTICDEIFGRNCFVANISWQRTYSTRNDKEGIVVEAEHILVYGKEPGWKPNKLERTEDMDARYSSPDNDERLWKNGDATAPGAISHQGMVYAIQHPITGKLLYPTQGRHWALGQDQIFSIMKEWAEYERRPIDDIEKRREICGTDNVPEMIDAIMLHNEARGKKQAIARYKKGKWPLLFFSGEGDSGIRKKTYLDSVEGRLISNLWPYEEVGHTDEAKKELKEIFDGQCPFDTPKPTRLIERILDIATDENDLVLDCFAGSGTTAHAVLLANQKKHSNRKFILIELKDFAETTTAYRVKKAITGYKAKMKHEEEIYSKKLTIATLKNASKYLEEARAVAEQEKANYATIGKAKLEDNCIKVYASRAEKNGMVKGLPGSFDYYELGQPLFKDGNLNEEVDEEKIRKYIYYTETRQPLTRKRKRGSYLLDTLKGTGYYFYYQRDRLTNLSLETLGKIVSEESSQYLIYADTCTIDETTRNELNIIFKQIPRDIKRF
jgi:adenine-specific DNA-methyltransferase